MNKDQMDAAIRAALVKLYPGMGADMPVGAVYRACMITGMRAAADIAQDNPRVETNRRLDIADAIRRAADELSKP